MCQRLLMRFCPICLMMERRSKVAGNEQGFVFGRAIELLKNNKLQKMNKEQKVEGTSVSPADTKPHVICRFCEEDLDSCWTYHKSYLLDILNGDYDLEEAREDLAGLIGSEFDPRPKNGV